MQLTVFDAGGCIKSLNYLIFYSSPTTKAVGSNFVKSLEPTALVVGAQNIFR